MGGSLSGESDDLQDRWSVGTRESRDSVRSLPLPNGDHSSRDSDGEPMLSFPKVLSRRSSGISSIATPESPAPLNIPSIDTLAYKLDTSFQLGCTVHPQGGKFAGTWTEMEIIGQGAQGTVSLEQCLSHKPQLRAIKKVPQLLMKSNNIDIQRELYAMIAVVEVIHSQYPLKD